MRDTVIVSAETFKKVRKAFDTLSMCLYYGTDTKHLLCEHPDILETMEDLISQLKAKGSEGVSAYEKDSR